MAFLIQQLLFPLLLAALFGALAGWCWHCIRTKDRFDKLSKQRDALRMEFATLTPALPGMRGLMPDPELEAAQMRADVAVAKVKELERLQEDVVAERDRFSARANELEMALAAAKATAGDGENWAIRFAALENERDAALRELEDVRAAWTADKQALLSAPDAAPAPEIDSVETRAQAWRVRLLEGRSEYLESRLAVARQPAPDDPRIAALTAQNEALSEDAEALRAEIAALKARPVAPTSPAAPDEDLNLLRWQGRYLAERVKYLEEQAMTPAPVAEAAPLAAPVAPEPAVDVEALNRRAWRQRYLEARLAYYDGRWREDRTGRITASQELAARTQRLETLDREVLDLRGVAEQNRARAVELETLLAQTRRDLETVGEERTGLRARLTQLDPKLEAQETELAALRARLAQIDALQVENADLKRRLGEQDALARDLAAARAGIQERDSEIARLRNQPMPTVDESEMMHLRFRTRFLDDRVKFLEARLAAQPAVRAPQTPRQTFMPSEPSEAEVRPQALPAARSGAPDDLRLIEGVSPRIESTLNSLGVYHFDQIATWTPENVAWVERYLAYKGRIGRERWVEQASRLARDEEAALRRRLREDEQV